MGKKNKKMVPALADSSAVPEGSAAAIGKTKKRKKDSVETLEPGAEVKKQKISSKDRFEGGGVRKEKKQKKKKGLGANLDEPTSGAVVEGAGQMDSGELKKKKKSKKGQEKEGVVVDLLDPNNVGAGKGLNGKQKKKEKTDKQMSAVVGGDAGETEDGAGHQNAGSKKKKKHQKEERVVEESMADGVSEKKSKDKGANGSVKVSSGGGDLGAARAALNMVVTGRDANTAKFRPLQTFEEANLSKVLLHGCAGFASPSPIQAQAWPIALAGRDLIGIAKTGSGKTIAFAVPALSHITKLGKPPKSPSCLVLAPTRELAIQIAEVFENAGKRCGVKTVCVYGGVPKGPQKTAIRGGATVVVATPGRLQDLVDEGACSIAQCGMLVLDEADRMLDLGFEPAIRKIIGLLPKAHQTSMFSATWPPEVAKLAAEFLRDPLKITIGSEDLTANHDVTQIVEVCEPTGREPKLEHLLRKYHADRKTRVLVFVLYKKEAAQMESYLTRKGWKAVAIHGDKGQADRSRALQQFRDGTIPLLIATDVAARGLDIPNVEYVINYSFPLTAEDYVHRIGRTGRAGKKGIAHTFFTVNDKARAGELQNILREAGQPVPEALTAFGTTVKKKESKLYGAHFREVDLDAKATKISFDSDDE